MANQYTWTFEDTFEHWLEKYNLLVKRTETEVNFRFLNSSNSTLVASFGVGQVRNGSVVEDLEATNLNFPANSQIIAGVYKFQHVDGTLDPAVITFFTLGNVPEKFFLPIYAFTTNANSITAVKDLRTPYSFGSGGADGFDGGVLMFDQHISRDVIINPLKNGLSVAPIIDDGFTVTVSDGSEWSVV